MSRLRIVLLVLLVIPVVTLACSSGDDSAGPPVADPGIPAGGSPAFRSGTRLRARVWRAPGGAQVFTKWEDTTLKTPCTFRPAEDAKIRCLPDVRNWGDAYFADEACSTPVAVLDAVYSPECPLPGFVQVGRRMEPGEPTCDRSSFAIATLGDQVSGARLFGMTGGQCTPSSTKRGASWAFAVTPLPPTMFVAVEPFEETRGGFRFRFLRAEDGAVQQDGLVDLGRGLACQPELGREATTGRCVPEAPVSRFEEEAEFADQECRQPILPFRKTTCAEQPPGFMRLGRGIRLGHECRIPLTTWRRTGPFDLRRPRYSLRTGACQPVRAPATSGYFEYATQVADTELAELRTSDVGAGRLRVRTIVGPGGERLGTAGFIDTKLGTPCERYELVGGARCLPRWLWWGLGGQYADPGCTGPYYMTPREPCNPNEFYLDVNSRGCGAPLQLLRAFGPIPARIAGPPPTGATRKGYGWSPEGKCIAAGEITPDMVAVPELSASSFARLDELVE